MRLVIPFPPKAQARPRAGRAWSKRLRRYVTRVYKCPKQRAYDDAVGLWLKTYCRRNGIKPLSGTLAFGVRVVLEPPKSWSKKKRAQALAGEIKPGSKPDLSNYIKTIEDIANGLLWGDDAQVVRYSPEPEKAYGPEARWEIEVKEVK